MKQILFLLLTITVISCKNKTQVTVRTSSNLEDTIKVENLKNKISIDFKENKDLLDIVLLLPDSVFSSWEWKIEDRMKWYNEIKENDYYIDESPDYFNQKYFEPNRAGFSIVDGFWSINIYKTAENSYIVITDDIVGDGNFLCFYEVKSNRLKEYLDEKTIFSDFKTQLKKEEGNENCEEKFKELDDPIFEFDFSNKNKNKIEIGSSWYLTKENYEDCLIGNSIFYNFNSETKKFEIEKIYWKPKKENND